jgi:protein O-GlcNAc transferase
LERDLTAAGPPPLLAAALDEHRAGRLDSAERHYREALRQDPQNADALHLLGVLRTQRGDAAGGIELIQQAIAVRPGAAPFHNNLGRAYADRGDWPAALGNYRRAVELEPRYAEAHYNIGVTLAASGDAASAESAYRRALALAPGDVRIRGNLGVTLQALGRLDEAEACFRAILADRPDDAEALVNLAGMLRVRGDRAAAQEHYRRALAVRPDFAKAHAGLGAVSLSAGNLDDAAAALQRAVELAPNDAFALENRAQLAMLLDDFPGANACYHRLLSMPHPDLLAWRNRLLALLYDPDVDEAERYTAHLEFGRAMAARVATRLPAPARAASHGRRLRVGWLSSDFRDHPVARNLRPFLEHRDRTRLEAFCYAEGDAADAAGAWFRANADAWRPITALDDAQVAAQIQADEVDVMFYLAGRFDRNRPQIAMWRPAPVQVSLFDGASSGLSEMDYFIADSIMVPPHPSERFTERVLRLPNFYVHAPIDDAPPVSPPPFLAAGRVTFGCFNNPLKVNSHVLRLWADILERVPTARLELKFQAYYRSHNLRARVLNVLAAQGIAAERVDFDGSADDLKTHLERYHGVDIALDPFPFTGSTTTFEALWMGVPVVALTGSTFMGRWSSSMLRHAGLGDLAASTREQYRDIAVDLALDRERLAALRASLRSRVAASSLCDGVRATRYLERALQAVWHKWSRGQAR